jgi:aryl-alcohol dehydrogenase-like predicted oxidoreductase
VCSISGYLLTSGSAVPVSPKPDGARPQLRHGIEKSARKLGVDQINLLILHQALPSAFDRTLEAYRGPGDAAR